MSDKKSYTPFRRKSAKKFVLNDGRSRDGVGYDHRKWGRFRARFLYYNPKCYVCGLPASQVDHIVPFKHDPEGFYRPANHVALCLSDHGYCTRKFDTFKEPKTQEKIEWMEKERRLRGLTFPIKVIAPED